MDVRPTKPGAVASAEPPPPSTPTTTTATASKPPPPPRRSPFAGFDALKVKNFRFYAMSGIFQTAAMNMQMLANGWYAYHLSGSSSVLGLTLLAQAIPMTFLSFVGGVVSDRVPRRYLMMMVFTVMALLSLWIGVSAQLGIIKWRDLVISAFVFGCAVAFLMPSRQGIIGELVGRERIMSAISLNQAIQSSMQFVGPAIGGFIIAWVSVQGAYFVITAGFLIAAAFMLPVRYQPRKVVSKAGIGGFLGNMRDGLKYARNNRDIFVVLVITFVVVSLASPYQSLLPVFAEDILKVGPDKLGLLSSLSGVGGLAGAMTVSLLGPRRRGLLYLQAALLTGAALVAFCISTSYAVSAVIVVAIGWGLAMRMTLSNILIQTYTEDAYVGRMLSLQMMEMGLTSFAGFGVAVLADAIGVRWSVGGAAALLAAASLAFMVYTPRMRKMA